MVLDEFGGIIGLVTMDDLLGAIFGSLQHVPEISGETTLDANGDSVVRVEGDMSVARFNKSMKMTLPNNIATTVGGWLLHMVGELPEEGHSVVVDGWQFTIAKVAANRITEIECRKELLPEPVAPATIASQPEPIKEG